jgi:hypothetical protein
MEATANFSEVSRDDMPDDVGGALAAFEEVTGTRVTVIRNKTLNPTDSTD